VRRGDADPNANGYLHANCDGNSYIYPYGYSYSNGNVYANPHGYGNVYANTNADSDTDIDTGTHQSDHADRNDVYTVPRRHRRDPRPPELQRRWREG
jgi:hypothetical protein